MPISKKDAIEFYRYLVWRCSDLGDGDIEKGIAVFKKEEGMPDVYADGVRSRFKREGVVWVADRIPRACMSGVVDRKLYEVRKNG